jgi:predicted enzyme related to lactoylglutathione lyase
VSVSTDRIESVGQIAIGVEDVDRACAFYDQVLGLRLLFRFPGMAFFDCGGVRLFLSRPEKPEFAGTSIVYYRVGDIHAAAEMLTARGVRFLHRPQVVHRDDRHELWMAFFQDSEGNHLAIMSETPHIGGA